MTDIEDDGECWGQDYNQILALGNRKLGRPLTGTQKPGCCKELWFFILRLLELLVTENYHNNNWRQSQKRSGKRILIIQKP